MRSTTFTEFRRNAKAYLDAVEQGEPLRILRHGRPIAEVVPPSESASPSWKRPGLRLSVKGASLSRAILAERNRAKK